MAITTLYTATGGTLAQYDQIIAGLGEAAQSPGGLAHIAAAVSNGFVVCDVWETLAAYEDFAPKLAPHTAAAGLAAQGVPIVGQLVGLFVSEMANETPAVAVIYRFSGMKADGYADVRRQVEFSAVSASKRRAHIAGETADGIFVVAVWESEAAFRSFEPALQAAFATGGIVVEAPVVGPIHRLGFMPGAVQTAHA